MELFPFWQYSLLWMFTVLAQPFGSEKQTEMTDASARGVPASTTERQSSYLGPLTLVMESPALPCIGLPCWALKSSVLPNHLTREPDWTVQIYARVGDQTRQRV